MRIMPSYDVILSPNSSVQSSLAYKQFENAVPLPSSLQSTILYPNIVRRSPRNSNRNVPYSNPEDAVKLNSLVDVVKDKEGK